MPGIDVCSVSRSLPYGCSQEISCSLPETLLNPYFPVPPIKANFEGSLSYDCMAPPGTDCMVQGCFGGTIAIGIPNIDIDAISATIMGCLAGGTVTCEEYETYILGPEMSYISWLFSSGALNIGTFVDMLGALTTAMECNPTEIWGLAKVAPPVQCLDNTLGCLDMKTQQDACRARQATAVMEVGARLALLGYKEGAGLRIAHGAGRAQFYQGMTFVDGLYVAPTGGYDEPGLTTDECVFRCTTQLWPGCFGFVREKQYIGHRRPKPNQNPTNECLTANNNVCEDETSCDYGTDCEDCGNTCSPKDNIKATCRWFVRAWGSNLDTPPSIIVTWIALH